MAFTDTFNQNNQQNNNINGVNGLQRVTISPSEQDVTIFAQTNYRNSTQKFGIRRKDRRHHMYLIGKTGMGKSTLIENLVLNDAKCGEGFAVIDPHGDLIKHILSHLPPYRLQDVVYVNPADFEHPTAFNVLEHSREVPSYRMASGLISVFKKIWKDSWGPRLEHILRNSLLTLLEVQETTLLDLPKLLTDNGFRAAILEVIEDEQIKNFWKKEFEAYSPNFRTEAIAPILNKIGQFLVSSVIRNIVGQKKSSFNIRQIMDGGKILLLDLAKGRIGEDVSSLLGALFLTQFELAALSRSDTSEKNRRDFFLYIDELHSIATTSFISILSESRKYHLNMVMSHQYLKQLDEELEAAILGNVGTIVAFRVGAYDAEVLAKEFAPHFNQEALVNLSQHHIAIKLMINGISSQAFSGVTLPPQHLSQIESTT